MNKFIVQYSIILTHFFIGVSCQNSHDAKVQADKNEGQNTSEPVLISVSDLKDQIMTESSSAITLKIRNNASSLMEITDIPQKIEQADYILNLSSTFIDSCAINQELRPNGECNLYYIFRPKGKEGKISLNQNIKITYKEPLQIHTRTVDVILKGSVNWLSNAHLKHELKLNAEKMRLNDPHRVGIIIKNQGQYPALIPWKRSVTYTYATNNPPDIIDYDKTTCKTADGIYFILEPGAKCELLLIKAVAKASSNIKFEYHVHGFKGEIPLDIK